jgi:uncharacterized GH25 family protein
MKTRYLFIFCFLFVIGLVVKASDYLLIPENFFLHKGEMLRLHLQMAEYFDKQKEVDYQPAQPPKLLMHEGSKFVDLKGSVKDTGAVLLSYKMENSGLYLVELTQSYPAVDIDRGAFIRELDEDGLTKLSEKANAGYQQDIRIKYIAYLKTLFIVDKSSGDVFKKEVGQELELIMDQNPYKLKYGDDITATVKFKGKPLPNAHVDLLVKTSTGKIYPQRLISDDGGHVFFKVSLEGNYLLRTVNIEQSKSKDVDYEKWAAAYTFAFSNTGTLPPSY